MGYTHYWTYPPSDPGYRRAWPGLVTDTTLILDAATAAGIHLAGPSGTGAPRCDLTGGIGFNGDQSRDEDVESFVLQPPDPLHPGSSQQPGHPGTSVPAGTGGGHEPVRDFCKTYGHPYDVAVCAVLLRFRLVLPGVFGLSSDGDWDTEWARGTTPAGLPPALPVGRRLSARNLLGGLFGPVPATDPLDRPGRYPAGCQHIPRLLHPSGHVSQHHHNRCPGAGTNAGQQRSPAPGCPTRRGAPEVSQHHPPQHQPPSQRQQHGQDPRTRAISRPTLANPGLRAIGATEALHRWPLTPGIRAGSRIGFLTGLGCGLILTAAALLKSRQRIRVVRRVAGQALYEASHDHLTGLPGRKAALEHLDQRRPGMAGVLDLDGFKQVNDRHGHPAGDQLLTVIGARLTAAIGTHGIVARLSGDEFLILWHHAPAHPVRHSTELLRQVTVPATIGGHDLTPAASLGLACAGPALAGTGLLAAADAAMYQAKALTRRHTETAGQHDQHPWPGGVFLYPGTRPPAPIDRRATGRRPRPPTGTGTQTASGQPSPGTAGTQRTILEGDPR